MNAKNIIKYLKSERERVKLNYENDQETKNKYIERHDLESAVKWDKYASHDFSLLVELDNIIRDVTR